MQRAGWYLGLVAAGLLVLVMVAATIFWIRIRAEAPAATGASDQPTDRPIVQRAPGFVGSAACQRCHEDQFATWHASYHRTMTQIAGPDSVKGDFDDVTLQLLGKPFHLERQGDQYWVEMPDPDWTGPETQRPRIRREIVQVTGSHHMQVYWYPIRESRMLGQLPFVYLLDEQAWIPREAGFLRPAAERLTSETSRWNYVCVRCHTTGPQPGYRWSPTENPAVQHAGITDTRLSEFGISCEACHGPGAEHVRAHEQSRDVDARAALVVPSELPTHLSSQVCGQCHGLSFFRTTEEFVRWSEKGSAFRPGQDLEQVERYFLRPDSNRPEVKKALREWPREAVLWSDGMVRVTGREYSGLLASPCFEHDDGERRISCFSCHRLHPDRGEHASFEQWADDQLRPGMRTSQACTQCHESYRDAARRAEHTHHAAASSGSSCLNCHMPHTTYGLLKAVRSHQIDSPTVQSSLEAGRPNACNQCHLDRSLGWSADYLERWYGIEPPELSDDQKTVSAAVLWTLTGEAGQRAWMAWSMGWADALEASSGGDWTLPYLIELLDDPYPAVRIIAWRSLKSRPDFEGPDFEPNAPEPARQQAVARLRDWLGGNADNLIRTRGSAILIDDRGQVRAAEVRRLLEQRDHTMINLLE